MSHTFNDVQDRCVKDGFFIFLFEKLKTEKLRRKMSVSAIDVWRKVARIPSIKSAYFKNDLIFANLEISLVSFNKRILQATAQTLH